MPDLADPFVITVTVSEYVAFALMCLINVRIYQKYRERGTDLSFLLFKALFCMSFAPVLQSLDTFFLDTVTTQAMGYIASFGYSAAMTCGAIGNYFLAQFIFEIFGTGEAGGGEAGGGEAGGGAAGETIAEAAKSPWNTPRVLGLAGIGNIGFFVVLKSLNYAMLSTVFMLVHVLVSITIYAFLVRRSFGAAARLEDRLHARAMQAIGLLGVFLVLMYALFITEAVVAYGTYSIFGALGWISAAIGAFCAYVGFCLPPWFQRLLGGAGTSPES